MFRRFSPTWSQMAKYCQRQERSQSSLFQWNGDMLTGLVSIPIAERTSALTSVNFCAVSHMWEAMQHPDPWGFQLAQIAEKYRERVGNGLTWVFLDYVSLFQFRRTPEEDGWFYKALDGMHILYSHEAVEVTLLTDLTPEHLKSAREVWAFSEAESLVVLMSIAMLKLNATPHHLRGWCQAEKQWALLRGLLLAGCVPLCPDAFKQLMQEMRFTHRNLGIEELNPGKIWKHWSSPSWGRFILQEIWYQLFSIFSKFMWATKFHRISSLDLKSGTMRPWSTSSRRKSSRWKLPPQPSFNWRNLTVWRSKTCGRLCLTTPSSQTSRWVGPHWRTKTQ